MGEVRDLNEKRNDDQRRKRLWIWLGVGALLVALIGTGFYITEQPWFCSGSVCHEMTDSYQGWEASAHPNIGCTDCHAEPGIAGFLEAHVQDGLRDVWVHVTERPETVSRDIVEPIPPSNCLQSECHEDQFDALEGEGQVEEDRELPSTHPDPDSDCARCHYDEIHEPE